MICENILNHNQSMDISHFKCFNRKMSDFFSQTSGNMLIIRSIKHYCGYRNDIQIVNDLMHYSINNAEVSIQDQQFYECAVKELRLKLA